MSEQIKFEVPKEDILAEGLNDIFSVRNSDLLSVLTVIVGFASLGWLADSVLPFLHDLAVILFRLNDVETKFRESAVKLVLPLAWFVFFCVFLYRNRRKNLKEISFEQTVPERSKGLIVMLSKYTSRRDKDGKLIGFQDTAQLETAVNEPDFDKNLIFAGCNWGQMAFAVAYHSPVLQKCWVITTKNGSSDEYKAAEKLIKNFSNRIESIQVEIEDENDIAKTANTIKNIYRDAEQHGFDSKDIVADFTGGTSAMSGGMILATLADNRRIEFLKQDFRNSLSAERLENINEERLILSPVTNLVFAKNLTRR